MNLNTAQLLLKELLQCLPTEWWWLLHRFNEDRLDIADAFGRPRAEIEALLVVAGVARVNGNGISILRNPWETFRDTELKDPLFHGSYRRGIYIANVKPPEYNAPKNQANTRCQRTELLPDNLIESLKEAAAQYDLLLEQQCQARIAKEKEAKAATEASAKAKAKVRARHAQYPIASNVFGSEEELSLKNDKVREWSRNAMSEIANLYSCADEEPSYTGRNGVEMTLLVVPRTNDVKTFEEAERQTKWVKRLINVSRGSRLSASAAVRCIQHQLNRHDPKPEREDDVEENVLTVSESEVTPVVRY